MFAEVVLIAKPLPNMPISYPITLPTTRVRSVQISPRSAVAVAESPFTYQQQTYVHPGQAWGLSVTLVPMKRADYEVWLSSLLSLNGREGTFLFGDTAAPNPQGNIVGSVPVVHGAGQTGSDLIVRGWAVSTSNVMKAGDWVQLGSGSTARLFKNLADASSNGSGHATLTLWPKIRTAYADGAALTVTNPKGLWRLTEEISWRELESKLLEGLVFNAVQAL